MENKKVAYVATMFSHLALFHVRFMKNLQSEGHAVHAYGKPDHCKADVERAAIECRDIHFNRNPLHPENFKALRSLMQWFKRERYDLIHVHTPNASVIGRIGAALVSGSNKIVYTAHGFHFYKGAPWLNWLVYYPAEWIMARFTDVLITINREDYERVRHFPVRQKVVYIPGVGVDVERYRHVDLLRVNSLRAQLSLSQEQFIVLCLAELNENKNQVQLIRAVQEMRKQQIPVVCLLAGTGEWEEQLKALVRSLQLEESVRFLGFRQDTPELLQLADCVALMSKREGLPKVLLEAMAAGKPMVATDVRGSRELVTPHVNGYLVPLDSKEATVQALMELYANEELRSEMGRQSYAIAEARPVALSESICRLS